MNLSRRQLAVVLPALAAAAVRSGSVQAAGQAAPAPGAQASSAAKLDTAMFHHERIPYTGNDTKKGRRFFMGQTHGGFVLEMHETILGPGTETHAPHKHVHEEIIVVVEGTVEAYNEGVTDTLEPGSVIFFGSNQMHSARNVGTGPARYYVIELRGDEA